MTALNKNTRVSEPHAESSAAGSRGRRFDVNALSSFGLGALRPLRGDFFPVLPHVRSPGSSPGLWLVLPRIKSGVRAAVRLAKPVASKASPVGPFAGFNQSPRLIDRLCRSPLTPVGLFGGSIDPPDQSWPPHPSACCDNRRAR